MREKVLPVLFIAALLMLGGALYFSHNQAEPVAGPDKGTTVVEPANVSEGQMSEEPEGQPTCVEGKEVALFGGDVTAVIYTDIVKASRGNVYEQTIFVKVYTKESFNIKIESLGGELLEKLTIGDNDGYDIESVHCVSPDPAVIMTVKHGSKVERALLVRDVMRR